MSNPVRQWRFASLQHIDSGQRCSLGDISFINYLDEDIQLPSDDFLYVTGTPGQVDFRAFTIDSRERFGFSHGRCLSARCRPAKCGPTQVGPRINLETWPLRSRQQVRTTHFQVTSILSTCLRSTIFIGTSLRSERCHNGASMEWNQPRPSARITSFLELVPTAIQPQATPGAWSGVSMQSFSNDRNVGVIVEREPARSSAPSAIDSPANAQYLGQFVDTTKRWR